MKSMHSLLATAVAPIVLIVSAQPVAAAPLGEHHRPLRNIASAVVREVLDFRENTPLTGEQKKQMRQVVSTYRADINGVTKDVQSAREGMRIAVETYGAKSKEAVAAADHIAAVAKKRALLTAIVKEELKPFLKPEQIAAIQEARERVDRLAIEQLDIWAR